jgi:hypothetical protein
MAENEKDVPVKELDDGTVVAKVKLPKEFNPEVEEKVEVQAQEGEEHDEEGEHDEEISAETNEEREKIREARREERRLKKDLKRQRELTAKNKISSLEKRNEELAKRLAQLENGAASMRIAQIDKSIEDEATKVEYAKMKMLQAAQSGDAAAQVEYLEQLTDAKTRLQQIQHYKKQQIEAAKSPKQNVPNETSSEVQANATRWLKKNGWFDPQARDTDSRIAKVIDQELAADGWDPADPEYWDELDNRLSARLPHRYQSEKSEKPKRRAGPTPSSRSESSTVSKNTITLSRDRVQAIKDAGAWDDVERRNKMIRAYAQYDRQNKG